MTENIVSLGDDVLGCSTLCYQGGSIPSGQANGFIGEIALRRKFREHPGKKCG